MFSFLCGLISDIVFIHCFLVEVVFFLAVRTYSFPLCSLSSYNILLLFHNSLSIIFEKVFQIFLFIFFKDLNYLKLKLNAIFHKRNTTEIKNKIFYRRKLHFNNINSVSSYRASFLFINK